MKEHLKHIKIFKPINDWLEQTSAKHIKEHLKLLKVIKKNE